MIKNHKKEDLQTAFLQGVLYGPMTVLPATLVQIPIRMRGHRSIDLMNIVGGILDVLFISFFLIIIAYILAFSFGTLVWLVLIRINQLNLAGLMLGSLVPSIITGIYTGEINLALTFAYYSLVVSFFCWFFGLRHIQK